MQIVNWIIMAISTVAIAAATGLGLIVYAQMPPVMAGVSALLIVLALVQIQIMMTRSRRRIGLHFKMRTLLKSNAGLSEEVVTLHEQVKIQEKFLVQSEERRGSELKKALEPLKQHIERIEEQFGALNAVNAELTEGLVNSGKRLDELTKLIKRMGRKQKQLSQQPKQENRSEEAPDTARKTASAPAAHVKKPEPQLIDPARHEDIRQSLEQNRLDLYLQPVVTLPQRKVRYYEAFTWLRGEDGEVILPADYMPVARAAGLLPDVDNLVLLRSVKVLRRLLERNRRVGIFCNISPESLADANFFPQLLDFLGKNTKLRNSLIFEFPQSMIDKFGPIELESLHALNELGFKFSLDHVRSLGGDFQKLNEMGFRYLKADADLLLNRMEETDTWVHTADLSALLERHGIHLIAEKIESEKTVLDLLDYNIPMAQGYLFGKPAQVRDDILGRSAPAKQNMKMAS